MKPLKWVFCLAALCLAVAGGMLIALESPVPAKLYSELRYTIRQTFGLQRGWHRLPGPADAAGHDVVDCPSPNRTRVIVTGGQSNAANSNSMRYSAGDQVAVWFGGGLEGRCYRAQDPLLGATGSGGSLWSLLGDRIAQATNAPVLLINGAAGGAQYADWTDPRSGYLAALVHRIESARAAGYEPDLLIWHQGENDAKYEKDPERVRLQLDRLTRQLLEAAPRARLYLFQTSKCSAPEIINGREAIRAVQASVADGNPRIFLGMNTDTLGDDDRWDRCHFNSLGRQAIVERILPDMIGLLRP